MGEFNDVIEDSENVDDLTEDINASLQQPDSDENDHPIMVRTFKVFEASSADTISFPLTRINSYYFKPL